MPRLSPAMAGAVIAGLWFCVFVILQWGIAHWLSPSRRARLLVVGYGGCVIGFALTVPIVTGAGGRLLGVVFGAMTIACLFVLYTPFYYVVTSSLSVQSLVLLLDHQGRLPRERLLEAFAGRRLLGGRLQTLRRSGYVVEDGAAFRLTPRGRRVVAPFLGLKSLWRLGPGG